VTTTTTGSTTTSPPSQPAACTSAAVGQGIANSGAQVASVDDFRCGGWADANYTTHGVSVATLLKDEGGPWVVVDRAQNCNDPSIPANVHFYCTVS